MTDNVKVDFKRTFGAKSALHGLTISQTLGFVDVDCANRWIAGVKRNCPEIHDARITAVR